MITALPFLIAAATPQIAAEQTPRRGARAVLTVSATIITAEKISFKQISADEKQPQRQDRRQDRQIRKSGNKMIIEFH